MSSTFAFDQILWLQRIDLSLSLELIDIGFGNIGAVIIVVFDIRYSILL
jgi:hypothetical protein